MRFVISNKEDYKKYYIPIGLLVLNFIIKIIYLNNRSIADDEPFSIYVAQSDVSSIILQLIPGNNPPLFEILLHFWIKVFGISAFSTRFLPMLFSVTTVFFIYKIGVNFFNDKIAVISSLIFTFSNYQIFFSHQTRVYSLFALLTTISMFAFFNFIKDKIAKRYFMVLIIANILLIYSHFLGFFVIIIQMLCCIVFKDIRNKVFKPYCFSLVVILISYIPYLKILLTRFLDSSLNGTWVPPSKFEDLYRMVWRFSNAHLATVIFLIILAAAMVKLVVKNFNGITIYTKIILFWFLFPYLFMFFVSLKYLPIHMPVFIDRYLIFTSIGFCFILAISINYVFPYHNRYGSFTIGLLIIYYITTCNPNFDYKRHVSELMNKVMTLKSNKTIIYMCPDWFDLNFVYYYNINYFKEAEDVNRKTKLRKKISQEYIYPIRNQNQIDTNLINRADKVLYIDANADGAIPNNNIYSFLSKRYPKHKTYDYFKLLKLHVFEFSPGYSLTHDLK